MMRGIDIQGGYPALILDQPGDDSTMAASIAGWCRGHARAAWCLSPDHSGQLEVTFALASDRDAFIGWLALT